VYNITILIAVSYIQIFLILSDFLPKIKFKIYLEGDFFITLVRETAIESAYKNYFPYMTIGFLYNAVIYELILFIHRISIIKLQFSFDLVFVTKKGTNFIRETLV
jgi:hypothetical protein